jgi:hypothetical protein
MRSWLLGCVRPTKRDNACAGVAGVPRESARGEARANADWIPLLARMRWPAIGLCVAAAVANGAEWISGNAGLSAQFVAPAVLLLLAVLEYINYYHVQLQHFDHAPDWQRLVSGRGFRRSHLAREIERWKREQRRGG